MGAVVLYACEKPAGGCEVGHGGVVLYRLDVLPRMQLHVHVCQYSNSPDLWVALGGGVAVTVPDSFAVYVASACRSVESAP